MKRKLALGLVFVMCLSLAACGGSTGSSVPAELAASAPAASATQDTAPSVERVDLAMGCSTTSTWVYSFSIAMSEAVNNKLTLSTVYPEATSGSSAHYEMLDNNSIQLGTATTYTDQQASEGEGSFTKAYTGLSSLFPVSLTVCQIVVSADSPIKTVQDLEGKKVAIGGRGSPTSAMSEAVLSALNVTCDLSVSTHEEMLEMFKDNRVEAIVYFGGAPYSGILDISSGQSVRLIGLTDVDINTIVAASPALSKEAIEATSYDFLTDSVGTVRCMSDVICRSDISEDAIYELVKTVWESWGEICDVVPAAAAISTDDVSSMFLPLHPGALRYYEEIGVSIPDGLKG